MEHLSQADTAKRRPDFLVDELPQRLAKGPVRFRLMAQLAQPGDQTKNPTQPWPADGKLVDLGTIMLTKPAAGNAAAQKALTDGIEVSDNPLIDARDQACAVSSAAGRSSGSG